MYSFAGKFALVTGGAQGLGFAYINQLLRCGIEGVTLVDVNNELGKLSTEALIKEFGEKVIFACADVRNPDEFEAAFRTSIDHWKYLDIVVNNAGIVDEGRWELEISVNCAGTLRGVALSFQYMSNMKGGRGGIVINCGSIAGVDPYCVLPIYSATKSFVVGLGRAMGTPNYFEHTGVKVLTVCPGLTDTPIINDISNNVPFIMCPNIKEETTATLQNLHLQPVQCVAEALTAVIHKGDNGSVWVAEGSQTPYEIKFPARQEMKIN
ncbi:hypothetical protein RI129_010553 [Pyrocoelia pectoralis]|uniref:Alcohol dehydrogenase n=1 Tax=Pyrocoelia pectoralis TaxID=417401 RepID=A0AAN7ZEJ6_9COLE